MLVHFLCQGEGFIEYAQSQCRPADAPIGVGQQGKEKRSTESVTRDFMVGVSLAHLRHSALRRYLFHRCPCEDKLGLTKKIFESLTVGIFRQCPCIFPSTAPVAANHVQVTATNAKSMSNPEYVTYFLGESDGFATRPLSLRGIAQQPQIESKPRQASRPWVSAILEGSRLVLRRVVKSQGLLHTAAARGWVAALE